MLYLLCPRLQRADRLDSSPPGVKNGRYFADDIFICIFVNEAFCILIKISLKFVPKRLGLDDCLAPNRQQAIIWTNTDLIHWHIYAALGEMSSYKDAVFSVQEFP